MARRNWAAATVVIAVLAVVALMPDGFLRWTFPKYLLMGVAAFTGLFALRTGRMPRWAWWTIGAVIAAMIISAAFGAGASGGEIWAGLVGRWPRYLGPLTGVPVAAAAVWIGASFVGGRADPLVLRTFLSAAALAGFAVGALSTLEALGLRPIESNLERPGSLFGNATDQGIVSAMILMVLLAVAASRATWRDRILRVLVVLGIVGAAAGTVLSASRGALLAAGVGAGLLAVLLWRTRVITGRVALASAGGLVALVALAVLLLPGVASRFTGVDAVAASTVGERWMLWDLGLRAWMSAPIVGGGAGSAVDRFPVLHDTSWFIDRPTGTTLESAHNWAIDLALDGGIVLLAIALVGLLMLTRDGVRAVRDRTGSAVGPVAVGAASALVVAAVALLFHPTGPAVLLGAGLLAGALISRPLDTPQVRVAGRGVTIGIRVLVGSWVLALALATAAEVPLVRGTQAAQTRDSVSAAASFETASALRPWDVDIPVIAAQSLAAALFSGISADPDAALEWTERAVTRVPASVAALDARASTLELVGETEAAAATRADHVAAAPADPFARLNLAVDLAITGDWEQATTQARVVLELHPESSGAAGLLAELCAAQYAPAC